MNKRTLLSKRSGSARVCMIFEGLGSQKMTVKDWRPQRADWRDDAPEVRVSCACASRVSCASRGALFVCVPEA